MEHIRAAVAAVARFAGRLSRIMSSVIAVCRRHLPKWLMAVVAVTLAIPGPQDELLVALIIGVVVAVKPAMRADMVASVKQAWGRT